MCKLNGGRATRTVTMTRRTAPPERVDGSEEQRNPDFVLQSPIFTQSSSIFSIFIPTGPGSANFWFCALPRSRRVPAATGTSSLAGRAPSSRASTAGTSAGIERWAGTGAEAGGWVLRV